MSQIAANKLQVAFEQFRTSELIGVAFADFSGDILSADPTFLKMIGYSTCENLNLAKLTPSEAQIQDEEAFERIRAFGSCAPFQRELMRQDGSRVAVLFGATTFEDEFVFFVIDLTHDKEIRENLDHLAHHDSLTDLPNQSLFRDRLKQAIALSRRNKQMHAVLLLNLDRFKTFNDSLGYVVGDRVLQSVAQRLKSCIRDSDTVARFSGDEFAILLTEIASAQDAATAAHAIKEVLDQAFVFDEQELFVSTSIGISVYPSDGQETATLLKSAGTALDRAKEKGGNNYQFYASGTTTRALKQLLLENSLRLALERGEFVVEYQPLVSGRNFQLVGMEALVRWQHPTLGQLQPNEFIKLAEESGLILPIGEWVLRTACFQNKSWQDAGLEKMHLSVNFSARQFQQSTFISNVEQVLKDTKLEPSCLELELTESSIMKEPEKAIGKLQELRRMGIRIAVDDFGTGYSSLSYLKRFPIDTLKIDQSFICDVCQDKDDAAIVRAIVTLGHALGISVVAEGVETPEQLEYLIALECDVVQGFLFSKSLSTEDFEELLKEQRRVAEQRSGTSNRDFFTNRLPSISGPLQPARR
ncbi:MAG: putative bifunctional diguanylate cyclase/phosphodiesterase [Pyrinomonadaceae bacterium]